MKKEDLNRGWSFQKGSPMLMMALATGSFGRKVNLPHDYMIESDVRADAPAGAAMGYYTEGVATYTKELDIPAYRRIGIALRNRKTASLAGKRFLDYLQYR